jgi:hypothetical protein
MTFEGVSMKKMFLGLVVLLVFGFLFVGCDNGTTTDNGTAPTLTDAIVASSLADVSTNWTSANSFSQGTDTYIYFGVKGNDPDKDVVKFGYDVMYGGSSYFHYETSGSGSEAFTISIDPFTAGLGGIAMSNFTTVAAGYSLKIYVLDAKGNKSNVIETNTFEITL